MIDVYNKISAKCSTSVMNYKMNLSMLMTKGQLRKQNITLTD